MYARQAAATNVRAVGQEEEHVCDRQRRLVMACVEMLAEDGDHAAIHQLALQCEELVASGSK